MDIKEIKRDYEPGILIAINALRNIIEIFYGPFLTAYFIKTSYNSLFDLSIYNIISYIFLGLGGLIIGYIVRNKLKLFMFRVGVILNFIYVFWIVVLKEDILNYLPIIAAFYGISSIAYYYPLNLFMTKKVKNKERTKYVFVKNLIVKLTSIITPLVLGSIITTTNFELTAIIILFISLIQIILSFFIKTDDNKNYKFTPIRSLKRICKSKQVRNILKVDFFKGMSVSGGALETIMTVLIFSAFKTDLNLGILTSISSIFVILIQYLYSKFYKTKNDKKLIIICSIIPVMVLILLLIFKSNITLIIYYLCYSSFISILSLISDVRLYNIANTKFIKENNEMEFWSIREVILNMGRFTGYFFVLIIAIFGSMIYLNYLLIALTISIIAMACFLSNITKHEKIKE